LTFFGEYQRKHMPLSKRRARKGDGALIIQDQPAPWNLHVKSSWVFPFLVSDAKLDALIKSSKDKANLYTAGIGNECFSSLRNSHDY
jgi:hypothetical protein